MAERIRIPTVLPGDELTVEVERTGSSLGPVVLLTVSEGDGVSEVWLDIDGVDALILSLTAIRDFLPGPERREPCIPPPCPPAEEFTLGEMHSPEDCDHEWHCEAVAVGLEADTGVCTPFNPFHSAPCGWK